MVIQYSIVLLLALFRFHSIHISYGKAEVSSQNVHIKVSYYKDDLMKSVESWYGGKGTSLVVTESNSAEKEYFKHHLRLWSSRNFTHPLSIVSCSESEDATSIIFDAQYESDIPIEFLSIDHRALCNEFSDETNIISVNIFGSDRNVITTDSKPTVHLTK